MNWDQKNPQGLNSQSKDLKYVCVCVCVWIISMAICFTNGIKHSIMMGL